MARISRPAPTCAHASLPVRVQNARMWVIVAAAAVVLIYFILAMACGLTLSKC